MAHDRHEQICDSRRAQFYSVIAN